MKREVLKMTAYQVGGQLYKSKFKSEREVPEQEMCHNSWWYLHGKLQDVVGYDKAITTNCKSAGYSRDTIDWSEINDNQVQEVLQDRIRPVMYVNDIIPVEVEGFDEPCVGYFWTTDERLIYWKGVEYPYWKQRGLVCFKDDKEACEYAQKKYNERTRIL